ncbi:M90 family metallopeptidase [Pareuzebyella sediminis]|uniref:M90 family metallopeptidase n=1 Tax=Pareuzebyella sediminis TaxID=2607998 RepID=UPI0011EEA01C|nr:M90 family metallopeptidase [Pareuzebyella sediminis]
MNNWIVFLPFPLLLIIIIWRLWARKQEPNILSFKDEWRTILRDKVAFYRHLESSEKLRFEKEILQFFDDVTITGVEIEINDTDRLLVAASGIIPLFGFPELRYRNINEVLLYTTSFNADNQTVGEERNILGKVGSGNMNRLMILSLPALHAGFENENSKSNVGIHEFVHLIDKADGAVDGVPESLIQKQYVIPWLDLIHKEIDSIRENHSDINPYGATSQVEFLSVASEYFFNQPKLLRENHPELYEQMAHIYRQKL